MTSARAGLRVAALASIVGAVGLYPGASRSGDEVDYSAPYLVVENGELVTKYPTKTHDAAESAATEATPAGSDDVSASSWLIPALLLAAIAGAGGLMIARTRR